MFHYRTALLLTLLFSSSSMAASFDCSKASTDVEHMICDNPTLSSFDEDMAKAYKSALARNPDDVVVIKKLQHDWIKMRDSIKDEGELSVAYQFQILGMNNLAPADEVNKDSDSSANEEQNGDSSSNDEQASSKKNDKEDNSKKHIPALEDYLKPYVNINGDYVSTTELVDGNPNLFVCASTVANDVVNMNKQKAIKNNQVDLFFQVKDRIHTASTNATYDMFIHDLSKSNICQFLPAGGL
ncbi:hypothetical protein [Rosenbergiella metrosideri]|uniref:hypothetical protein n=1 Tax=Rosenbergiella metrosideri TaxID=2921185 RepID=UPI001F4F6B0A|nr:hypothetical protein [Rosenbergiella metrosideri]